VLNNERVAMLRRPEIWSLVLAVAGIAIAAYLTLVHYRDSLLVCSGISNCETVQNSSYSEVAGVPVALMGLIMFVGLFGMMVLRMARPELADTLTLIIFVLAVGAIAFYIYLTYLELFVIEAICQWCVASSLVTLGLLVTEGILLRRLFDTGAH
jgi:uncharacterized membrane protein